jgi:hypothetical protein
MPRSIFESHSGAFPFSVQKLTSKPASLKAAYGMVVSEAGQWGSEIFGSFGQGAQTRRIVTIVGHQEDSFDHNGQRFKGI